MNETKDSLENDEIFQDDWYHSIELFPGRFTAGYDFHNIALTRDLMRGCAIENMNCLDIGAQDFLTTLLFLRRGASKVTAYDRIDKGERAESMKRIFNVDFEHIKGMSLAELPLTCKKNGMPPFDVVVFSGVLYHMFDPLGALAVVRGLVRNGGVLIFETSALLNNKMAMFFNAAGKFYGGTNYFQPSVECLDYMLRFLRLAPLDCHFWMPRRLLNRNKLGRVAIACRAVEHCIPCKNDSWMKNSETDVSSKDFEEFLDWNYVKSNGLPDVEYQARNRNLSFRKDTNTVNIYKTLKSGPQFKVDNVDEQVRLKLDAKW